MARLKPQQWRTAEAGFTAARLTKHGLPKRRSGSVLLGTFNIRKLGSDKNRTGNGRKGRTPGAWRLLARACAPFDLLAIQEVQDDLSGLVRLQRDLEADHGRKFQLLVSDIAGSRPGGKGMTERMAFLYDKNRITHTELSSEITADRAQVTATLFSRWQDFERSIREWHQQNRNRSKKSAFELPTFLTFIRAPHVGSFRILPKTNGKPIDLLAVNAHLLFGKDEDERLWEFLELVEWLSLRAKYPDKLYAPNLFLLGDCNLETANLATAVAAENPPAEVTGSARAFLEWKIKSLNATKLKSKKSADANFPLLDDHPVQGPLRTNARHDETYDQIGLFCRDRRLPRHDANTNVTGTGDTYDYGVFRFTDLIAELLEKDAWDDAVVKHGNAPGSPFNDLKSSVRKRVIGWLEYDVSDHFPAWIRLPRP